MHPNAADVYFDLIKPLQPFSFSNQSSRKPNLKEYKEYANRLECLITGLVINSELSGNLLTKLIEEIKK